MYKAIIIPKPNNSVDLTKAINEAIPSGHKIVAIYVDGNNLVIIFQ